MAGAAWARARVVMAASVTTCQARVAAPAAGRGRTAGARVPEESSGPGASTRATVTTAPRVAPWTACASVNLASRETGETGELQSATVDTF